jgi:hypothetical protein
MGRHDQMGKKSTLIKLRTYRTIQKRNHRVKLNPQDEALKAKRLTSTRKRHGNTN